MGKTSSGLVPHVTTGAMSSAFRKSSFSNLASGSEYSVFQNSTAFSHFFPVGECGLPLTYSIVFSSGAINPALAPPSIAILHTVIRPSIERLSIALPQYSITCPVPPAVPVFPMIVSVMSLAVTPLPRTPDTSTFIFLDFC